MYKKERVLSLIDTALKEMDLLFEMSLQYITESFVKIRNLCGNDFFKSYNQVPWPSVFGMRNFLSHEYGDVDAEGIYNTIKTNIPELWQATQIIRKDCMDGKLDSFFKKV